MRGVLKMIFGREKKANEEGVEREEAVSIDYDKILGFLDRVAGRVVPGDRIFFKMFVYVYYRVYGGEHGDFLQMVLPSLFSKDEHSAVILKVLMNLEGAGVFEEFVDMYAGLVYFWKEHLPMLTTSAVDRGYFVLDGFWSGVEKGREL